MSQGFTKGTPIDTDSTLSLNSDIVVPSQAAIKTYVDNGLSNKVNRSGDTMSGYLILNANPLAPLGAATKDYVDTLINGIDWKQAADAGTVAALPTYTVTGSGQVLTGTANGAIPSATTDGVTLTATQRVLVKNETSTLTPNNGIYVVTQVGSATLPFILTRASDANTSALISEATLSIKAGTTLANTQWHCNPATIPLVIGTTNITFAQIGGGTYTFSPPLAVAGNVVSIPVATSLVDGYLTAADWSNFNGKLTPNAPIVGATKTKITYDSNGLVTAGADIVASDISDSSTVGQNLVKLTNPNAISFLRVNADNTVTARTPAEVLTDLGVAATIILARDNAAYSLTGTTTNTAVWSIAVAANTLQTNDFIEWFTIFNTNSPNTVPVSLRYYVNTSPTLVGALLLGQFTNTVGTGNTHYMRMITVTASGASGNLRVISTSNLASSSYGVSASNATNVTVNTTSTLYLITAITNGNLTTTSSLQSTLIRLTR